MKKDIENKFNTVYNRAIENGVSIKDSTDIACKFLTKYGFEYRKEWYYMEMKPMTEKEFRQWQKENIDVIPEQQLKEYQKEADEFLKQELGKDFFDKKKTIKMI